EVAEEADAWTEVFDTIEGVLDRADDPVLVGELALWLGELYRDRVGYQRDAIQAYERVLAVDDVNTTAMDALELLYDETGAVRPLQELLQGRLNTAKDTARGGVLERLAAATHRVDGPEAALVWWKELLWERPDNEAARKAVIELLDVDATAETAAGLLEPIFQREEDWAGLTSVLQTRARLEADPAHSVALWLRLASLREKELQDSEGAFDAYAEAIAVSPERRDVLRGLERMAEAAGKWEQLADELERLNDVLEVEGRRTEVLVRLGEIYEGRLSRPDRAIDSLRAALAIDEESRAVLKGLRRLYAAVDQSEPLLDVTRRLAMLARRPLEARELWTSVQGLSEAQGDIEGTLEATRKVLEIAPSDEAASERLMDLLIQVEAFDELAERLELRSRETTSPEKTANNLVRLAIVREQHMDDPKGALAAYLEAWEQMPTHQEAYTAIRERYERDERWGDLLVVSRRRAESIDTPSAAASAWIDVAKLASERLYEPKEATRALEMALSLDKRNRDVLRELARLAEAQGRMEDLAGYLTQLADVVDDDDQKVEYKVRAAMLYMEDLADRSRADRLLESVLRQAPEHVGAVNALARLRTSQARYAEAAGLLERVVSSHVGAAKIDTLCQLSSLYDGYLGRTADARELLKEALE
ncbi:MAG: hypothetical protein QF464_12330, partial [Myxococcota bacterium]|nr:hypothetical protein [Myxococcota bacterium]